MVKSSHLLIIVFMLVLAAFGTSGCTQSFAPVNNQILLEGGKTGSGEYKVGGLSMSYNYETVGSRMGFNGILTSSWLYNSIVVRIYFFDENSVLLKQKIVYFSTVRRSLRSGLAFEAMLDVPAGATGLAFKVTGDQWVDSK